MVIDPLDYEEAVKSERQRNAMDIEIEAIEKNDTWELFNQLKVIQSLEVMYVHKTKLNEKGEIDNFKVRLVTKTYAQNVIMTHSFD